MAPVLPTMFVVVCACGGPLVWSAVPFLSVKSWVQRSSCTHSKRWCKPHLSLELMIHPKHVMCLSFQHMLLHTLGAATSEAHASTDSYSTGTDSGSSSPCRGAAAVGSGQRGFHRHYPAHRRVSKI